MDFQPFSSTALCYCRHCGHCGATVVIVVVIVVPLRLSLWSYYGGTVATVMLLWLSLWWCHCGVTVFPLWLSLWCHHDTVVPALVTTVVPVVHCGGTGVTVRHCDTVVSFGHCACHSGATAIPISSILGHFFDF